MCVKHLNLGGMNQLALFLTCVRLLWCSRVLALAYYTLFYLPALGVGDFAQALSLLGMVALGFCLKEAQRGREKALFLQLKGLFFLSLRMPCDIIAFLSSLTQQ